MTIAWLQPLAWLGLAALLVPLLVHLLARQQSRRVPFPSLRFLRASRLAALSRRSVSDWPLLIVRALALAAAVAALAGPLVISGSRRAAWNERVVRAVVTVPAGAPDAAAADAIARVLADETRTAFSSTVIRPASVADGVRDAAVWLGQQPAARREVVLLGDLRAGDAGAQDFSVLPPYVGVRVLPVPGSPAPRESTLVVASAGSDGAPILRRVRMELDANGTRIEVGAVVDAETPISVRTPRADAARAQAVLEAVLADGLVVGPGSADRRLVVDFGTPAGGREASIARPASPDWMRRALEQLPDLRGGAEGTALVVMAGMSVTDPRAPSVVARAAARVFEPGGGVDEPRRIPAATVAAWSRPMGPAPPGTVLVDEGDGRWFWGVALGLLMVEHVLRSSRRGRARDEAMSDTTEARVA